MNRKQENKLYLEELPVSIKEHILQLERVRSDFVANVSHELRTPLTVIRGYLETLLKKDDSEIKPWRQIFNQMHQHSIRMENIINDLLLLSQLEKEAQPIVEKQNIAVANILETLCIDAKRISSDKRHIIKCHADANLSLHGYEGGLKSLFSNIIINAVKYTPPKGSIIVKWYRENDHAIFSVADTGIGIAKEHIPRITERFYRVDKARSRDSGGTGLGLAIVKHVLMRHQGKLTIASYPDKGSTFTCKFPKNRTVVIKPS